METANPGRNCDETDPQAQLAMLEAVQIATESESWMPPTPVWHAPILASAIAGLALVNDGPDGWRFAGAAVGIVAMVLALADQARRQRARPRRMSMPRRAVVFYGFMMVVSFIIVALWSLIDLPNSSGDAALSLIGLWLATTAILAAGISITNRMRSHWIKSQR